MTQGEYFVLWLARLHDELLFDRAGPLVERRAAALVATVLVVTGLVVWWPGVERAGSAA